MGIPHIPSFIFFRDPQQHSHRQPPSLLLNLLQKDSYDPNGERASPYASGRRGAATMEKV